MNSLRVSSNQSAVARFRVDTCISIGAEVGLMRSNEGRVQEEYNHNGEVFQVDDSKRSRFCCILLGRREVNDQA